MPVEYDQQSNDGKADSLADQARCARDPLQGLSFKQSAEDLDFPLRYWSEPDAGSGSRIHRGFFCFTFFQADCVPSNPAQISSEENRSPIGDFEIGDFSLLGFKIPF